ncbi:MAG: FHA domain-containing protein [Candidatus Ornithomonoglobus sp.]
MVILSYKLVIAASAVLLFLAAMTLFIVHKKRKKRKTSVDISVNITDFKPPLPVSNIIKDKIRRPIPYSTHAIKKKNMVVLRLTELSSRTVYNVKLRKTVTIGRKMRCNIRIKDTTVAPVHCFISFYNGQAYVEDNNTLNGTILNGILIKNRVPIFTNDLILIGNEEYRVEVTL